MRSALLCTLVAIALCAAPTLAQLPEAFPLQPVGLSPGSGPAGGLPQWAAQPGAVRSLASRPLAEARFSGFLLPSGEQVELALRRIDLERLGMRFQVDGQPAPGLLESIDLSVWTGSVVGREGSDVLLSFSTRGTRGWVDTGSELVHLMPQPDPDAGWGRSHSLLVRDELLQQLGLGQDLRCGLEQLADRGGPASQQPPAAGGSGVVGPRAPGGTSPAGTQGGTWSGGCSFWEARIAVETDHQLFQVFGDLGAETAYMGTLLGAVSDRYQTQIDTVLTYPYIQFYTTPADPWSTPDVPGSTGQMLDEFQIAWQGNIPAGADLAHFVSGAPLGGGIAYLSVLCDDASDFAFAVSANIDGLTPFPVQSGPTTWDFIVFAHETGHNFSSPHTHDFAPPIDNCANGDCISNGTIMSYCHLCPGGLLNMTTYFQEPTCTGVMQSHASSCLPFFAPLVAQQGPSLITAGSPTPLTVSVLGTPVGGVQLQYRMDPGSSFSSLPASLLAGTTWTATLPGPACGDQPEWFFSTTDQGCGFFQTATSSAEVGTSTLEVDDALELATGWTVGAPGDAATTGVWVHGNPNGTAAQPEDDHSPSGSNCWFTGQGAVGGGLGDNDVDGGATTLRSPLLDLTGIADPHVGYWRWFSNNAGSGANEEVFVVSVSNNGGGSWTTVETVGPIGPESSGGWFQHEFRVADFVAPTASVQLRFVAQDTGSGSLVEAAIDDLTVLGVTCEGPWTDLGGGTAGIAGVPALVMSGTLTPNSPLGLALSQGRPSALSFVWFSFASTPAPFLGGVLHAFPINIQILALTSPAGTLAGSANFPGAAPGQGIWVQVGITDPSGLGGGCLSNGVLGVVP